MSKTVINIKADKVVKKKAQEFARELGLPLSTILNAYLKDFIRKREITFSLEPEMSPKLEKIIAQAKKDYKEGKNIVGPFTSAEEMDDYLNS